jgi:hypothetical protein
VIILPVTIPFKLLIKGIIGAPFVQFFANPQSSHGGVQFPFLLIEAADSALSPIVVTMPSKNLMDLIDKQECKFFVFFIIRLPIQPQEIANRKSIGPQVSSWRLTRRRKSGKSGKRIHELYGGG